MELPNTKIRSVLPNPPQMGYAPFLIGAWNGGTVDVNRSRLLVWGGGHGDYWGNEMYALDLPTLSMKRIVDPSPYTAQASCTTALPDNTPTARHSYFGLTYIAHTDRFFAVNGSLSPCGDGDAATWTYDFSARAWNLAVRNSPMASTHGTMAVYDATTRKVFVKDMSDFNVYNPDTNTYTKLNTVQQANDYHLTATIDTKRRKFVMIGDGVQVIDLNTNQMTRMSTTNAPAFVTSRNAPGIDYDPVADRIVAWHGGNQVYTLNMDTGAWTQVAISGGPTSSPSSNGTYGRWRYIPAYRVFALVNSIDENAWVFRLTK